MYTYIDIVCLFVFLCCHINNETLKVNVSLILYIFMHADPLFTDSLDAEMAKNPDLALLRPKDGEAQPPPLLFTSRRKGYFKCPSLCRVWVLQTLRWLRCRGEYFVVWTHGGQTHDARYTLAHAFTLKYLSLHKPGMTVSLDKDGALNSSSDICVALRRYIDCLLACSLTEPCLFVPPVMRYA